MSQDKNTSVDSAQKKPPFKKNALIGAFLFGIPFSYFFQDDFIKQKMTWGEYVTRIHKIIGSGDGGLIFPVIISMLVFGIIGLVITHFISERKGVFTLNVNHTGPAATGGGTSSASKFDEIEKLHSLKEKGVLSEEEFEQQKKQILQKQ